MAPCCMTETIKEWLAKAEGDFRTAQREMQAADSPNYDAVCFHAQQCVEKLVEAMKDSKEGSGLLKQQCRKLKDDINQWLSQISKIPDQGGST